MVKVTDDGVFNAPRDKVWKLIEAHGTDPSGIHPWVKSAKVLRKEGNSNVVEQQVDMQGRLVKQVLKVTPNPPSTLTLEFLEGPMTGTMVNTYTDVPGGTKVTTVCDMKSLMMKDSELEAAVRQTLNTGFEEDTRYLSTKLK